MKRSIHEHNESLLLLLFYLLEPLGSLGTLNESRLIGNEFRNHKLDEQQNMLHHNDNPDNRVRGKEEGAVVGHLGK
jgi:hypothetical protein